MLRLIWQIVARGRKGSLHLLSIEELSIMGGCVVRPASRSRLYWTRDEEMERFMNVEVRPKALVRD